jgi:predicted dehydrogenase
MAKIRLGVIGAGGIVCRMHLPDLVKGDDFEVIVLGGRREHRLKYQSEQFNIPCWTQDYNTIIADDSLDAILVGTPHPLHVPWGVKALEAGKHVLMQKPLCGDMGEANQFVEATEKSGLTVMCLPHMSAPIYKVRQLLADGAIGRVSGARFRSSHGGPEIYYAEIRDIFGEEDDDLWFFDAKRASVGALFDMGVYAVAGLVAMLGTFTRVTGFVTTFDKPTELEDVATLVLEMESGGIVTAETSWCDPARTWGASVHGTAGKFTLPGEDGAALSQWTPTSYTRETAPVDVRAIDCSDANPAGMHEHFAECIRDGTQPALSDVYAARHITEILLAGMESSRQGKAIELTTRSDD